MTPWELAKSGTEHGEQRALFAWANMAKRSGIRVANDPLAYKGWQAPLNGVPELEWLHAIHNQGHGDAVRGARAKAEGVKSGVSDVFLPVTVKLDIKHGGTGAMHAISYAGLYIEMKKAKDGVESKKQQAFGNYCLSQGYRYEVCHGWEQARDKILEYLGMVRQAGGGRL